MTKLEVMKANQKNYAAMEKRIKGMGDGLEKLVAVNITLKWIKGTKWMGGLSDSVAMKAYGKLMDMGYSFDVIDAEFQRQQNWYEM